MHHGRLALLLFVVPGGAIGFASQLTPHCAPSDHLDDCAALLALWNATRRVLPWTFNGSLTLCAWPHVTCTTGGGAGGSDDDRGSSSGDGGGGSGSRVSELWLESLSLSGTLPIALRLLQRITTLDLAANRMSGSLPAQWSRSDFPRLHQLYLNENRFSGTIPSGLGGMRALRAGGILDLRGNRLTAMPESVCTLAPFAGGPCTNLTHCTQCDLSSNPFDCTQRPLPECATACNAQCGSEVIDVS